LLAFLEQNNALEATLEASPEKSVFDEATLTGYWKLPVIKGLNYQTPTHPAGVTVLEAPNAIDLTEKPPC
jgi:hypothetical protein